MPFTLDTFIVYGFLLLILIIGIFAGRNIKNMRDYAIANKAYGTPILIMTLLATEVGGGSTTGAAAKIFTHGLIFTCALSGMFFASLFIAYWIAPRLVKIPSSCLSVADVIEHYYGKTAGFLSAILGTMHSIAMISIQMLALGYVFKTYFELSFVYGMMIGGGIVVVYSAFGGIKSVTITDVIQFTVIIVVVPMITNVITNHIGGIPTILHQIDPKYLRVRDHPELNHYLAFFFIYAFPSFWLSPALIQRVLMAKDVQQIRQMFIANSFIRLSLLALLTMIAFAALVLFPEVEPKAIIPTIIHQLLPIGIKGIAIAGLLSILMSTIDSYLNIASTLLTHNLLKPLMGHRPINELLCVRITTFFLGSTSILIAFTDFDIVPLAIFSGVGWGCMIATSFALAILLPAAYKICFYSSALTSMSIWIGLTIEPMGLTDRQIQAIALSIGLITYLIAFYYLHKRTRIQA